MQTEFRLMIQQALHNTPLVPILDWCFDTTNTLDSRSSQVHAFPRNQDPTCAGSVWGGLLDGLVFLDLV